MSHARSRRAAAWVEELIDHRMRHSVFAAMFPACPQEPTDPTPAALPLWNEHTSAA
jgi:hypothetical protein